MAPRRWRILSPAICIVHTGDRILINLIFFSMVALRRCKCKCKCKCNNNNSNNTRGREGRRGKGTWAARVRYIWIRSVLSAASNLPCHAVLDSSVPCRLSVATAASTITSTPTPPRFLAVPYRLPITRTTGTTSNKKMMKEVAAYERRTTAAKHSSHGSYQLAQRFVWPSPALTDHA